ncbi:MAG TPA: hypothetical protein PLL78_14600 [Fimbriimonadaceae bacterium]|nr:hypothetical protein [Fimbriimonadaceae bacterium]HRJ97904.1 hypothetical protein [Fimbriimonadaceae bacterium]
MAKWRKRFDAWATARQPVPVSEVEALLTRVFGDRVVVHPGGSHRWTVDVPELVEVHDDFKFGQIGMPVSGGKHVKAIYCQIAFEAASLLGLLRDEDDEPEECN